MRTAPPHPNFNQLLRTIERAEYQKIQSELHEVQLAFGAVLYDVGDPITHVYFPGGALISLLTQVDTHSALEVGMVGPEGLLGTALALGSHTSPFKALVQGAGTAMRMGAAPFAKAMRQCPSLQQGVLLYTQSLMTQIAQTAACNRFHPIEMRLARWLLMTRDRVGSNHFHLTQDFLGNMLGVRREGVTVSAHALKARHLIEYSRGHIEIVDGHGLEVAACSCYHKLLSRHA